MTGRVLEADAGTLTEFSALPLVHAVLAGALLVRALDQTGSRISLGIARNPFFAFFSN